MFQLCSSVPSKLPPQQIKLFIHGFYALNSSKWRPCAILGFLKTSQQIINKNIRIIHLYMQSTCLQKSVTNREPTIVCRYLVITDKLLIDVNSTIHLHAQAVVQFALKLMKLTYIIKTRPVSECQTTTPIIRCDVVVEILHLVFAFLFRIDLICGVYVSCITSFVLSCSF